MRPDMPSDRMAFLQWGVAKGLSAAEVAQSKAEFGDNIIAERASRTPWQLLKDAAGDPMPWFLLLTSGLFMAVGQRLDAAVLLLAIVPLLGMDFYLHRRTHASLEALSDALAENTEVIRDGVRTRIASAALVVGDLVQVHAGEVFPADGIVVGAEGSLQVEESSLTGESLPIRKHPLAGHAEPSKDNWVLAGTRLLAGTSRVRVIRVGKETSYGEVIRLIVNPPGQKTRLQIALLKLVRDLLAAAAGLCILLASVRVIQGFGWLDALLSAAVLAVAAIPEEFPVVLTFFLGTGAYRLARRKALVRTASAVENIGRTTAICTDKTGTLTEGRLTISRVLPASGTDDADLLRLAALATGLDDADPLDEVILKQDSGVPSDGWIRLREFPFTEDRRKAGVIWLQPDGACQLALKGAPETVLELCEMSAGEKERWAKQVMALAKEGRKVIACASRPVPEDTVVEPTVGFQFAGLLGVSDPVRPEVYEAMRQAKAAGIQVVMITGDHPETAAAVARELGLDEDPKPVLGEQFEAEIAQWKGSRLDRLSVIARAAPAQKVTAVKALQAAGRVVAVTGDGVNDAPALRAADIAIAMGLRGTRTAREVSHIVLMDDNFGTIISAIAEGRTLFSNLRLSFSFLLLVHIPLVLSAALVPLAGYPLLYLPIHIVWLEMLIHPAAILGFQGAAPSSLDKCSPTRRDFFDRHDWSVILLTGGATTAGLVLLFANELQQSASVADARSSVLAGLVASIAAMVIILGRGKSIAGWMIASLAVLSLAVFSASELTRNLFHIAALDPAQWLAILACVLVPVVGATVLQRSRAASP